MLVRLRGIRGLVFGLAVLAACLMLSPAQASKRVALVIGNSAYRAVPQLVNPTNDAHDIAESLKRLGFDVHEISNATYDDMRHGLIAFGHKVRGSDIAVIYFAGHGLEVGGENYLVPVDAELKSDIDVDHEAISLRSILPSVENASRLGLVILDACRNDPFLAKMQRSIRTRAVMRGLVGVEPEGNVLVAYSAKDGTTASDGDGRNSPFTKALLKHIETPGLEISFVFRTVRDDVMKATKFEQQPFVYGSLSKEEIYLKAAPAVIAGPQADEITWRLLKDTDDQGALKRFVDQFPKSKLRAKAETRIAALTVEAEKRAAAPGPDELAWKLINGTHDAGALKRFADQFPNSPHRAEAARRAATIASEQDAAARELEKKMSALAAEAKAAKEANAKPTGPSPEDVAWSLVKDSKDPNQFRLFLDRFPKSAHKAEAETRMKAVAGDQQAAELALKKRMAALADAAEKAKLAPPVVALDSTEMARSMQFELKRVGCFSGDVTGEFGKTTQDALHKFAKLASVDLSTPELSMDTLKRLRAVDKRICPVQCKSGERAEGDRCVADVHEPKHKHVDSAPRESGGGGNGKCFSFNGRRFCE